MILLTLLILLQHNTMVDGERVAKLFSPHRQVNTMEKTLSTNCVIQCARNDSCVGTSISLTNSTCSYYDSAGLENLTDIDDVLLYRQTYPPPPTCENGGFWGDTSKTYCHCSGSFTGTNCQRYWRDCSEGFEQGASTSGVYTIKPKLSPDPFPVFCEMKWGGMTFIQKQETGIDYYRSWQEYKEGFGTPDGDHWLGLERIKQVCESRPCRLMVRLKYKSQPTWRQGYLHNFTLTGEADGYRLNFTNMTTVSNVRNQLSDALTELKGAQFSTYDNDNDENVRGNCAKTHRSGWWFKKCTPCNPNGRLKPIPVSVTGDPVEIFWPEDARGVTQTLIAVRIY